MSLYDPPNRPRTIDTDTYLELVKARANAFLARIGWSEYDANVGAGVSLEFEPITGGTGDYTEHMVLINLHLRDDHYARVYDEETGEGEWLDSEVWSPALDVVSSLHQLFLNAMEELRRTAPWPVVKVADGLIEKQKQEQIAKWAREDGTRVREVRDAESQRTT